ncbi:MAG: sensor histidine kinase [Pseudosphingobacterium sp.]|nr:sensor histidine kinase [Pseudosphingobacterium sp.]
MEKEFYWIRWYRRYRWLCHILFWVCIGLFYVLSYGRLAGPYVYLFALKELFIVTTLFYVFGYYIIPAFLRDGKLWVILCWLVFSYLWWCCITFTFCFLLRKEIPETEEMKRIINYLDFILDGGFRGMLFEKFSITILDFAYLVMMPFGIKLTKELVNKNNDNIRLERDHLHMEINYLKAQINPHFLLNALNSVNALVAQEHPYTEEAISILGRILNHTLYLPSNEKIPLREEVEIIRDYITMQDYRFGERATVDLDCGEISDTTMIMPHILLTFIENAFKHGVEKVRNDPFVHISIQVSEDNLLAFRISNNFLPSQNRKREGGIGTFNAKKRLDIFYKDNYELLIDQARDIYTVKLTVQL